MRTDRVALVPSTFPLLSSLRRILIGESLGPYKILELLGAGGMGEVYLGEDTRLGRKVAIIKWRQNES